MRIENKQKEIQKLDFEFFLFVINEKIKELEIESESFKLDERKLNRC